MHTPLTIPAFQQRWRGIVLTERAVSQSHFIDLDAKRRRWFDHPGSTPDQLALEGTAR